MLDLKWHDAPAQKMPANDNINLRNALEQSADADVRRMPTNFKQHASRQSVHGRAVDITALMAVLLWQFMLLVLLFVLM